MSAYMETRYVHQFTGVAHTESRESLCATRQAFAPGEGQSEMVRGGFPCSDVVRGTETWTRMLVEVAVVII